MYCLYACFDRTQNYIWKRLYIKLSSDQTNMAGVRGPSLFNYFSCFYYCVLRPSPLRFNELAIQTPSIFELATSIMNMICVAVQRYAHR